MTSITLSRLGAYFVQFENRPPETVAAIPNNLRSEASTTSPFGMGCYFAMRFTPDELKRAASLAALAGVAWSREELRWDIAEPKRGEFKWDRFDRGLKACADNQIRVLGLLDYWGADHPERDEVTSQALEDFAAYCARCVARYGGGPNTVPAWEIWNEPATFWFRSPEEFGRLTGTAAKALHKLSERLNVFFADAAPDFNSRAINVMPDGIRTFDGVTPHFYAPPRSPKQANLLANMESEIAQYRARGFEGPLWISEMGWHSDHRRETQLPQADYLVQSYVLALAAGYEKIFWYNFVCDSPDPHATGFGLLNRADYSPKVAYAAFAGMVHMLEGTTYTGTVRVGRNISAYLFRGASNDLAVAWADEGEGTLSPDLAEFPPGTFHVYDSFANELTDGTTGTAMVPLRRSPVFISRTRSIPRSESGKRDKSENEEEEEEEEENAGRSRLIGFLKEAKISGMPSLEYSLAPTTGSLTEGTTLHLIIDNASPRDVLCTPTIELKDSLVAQPHSLIVASQSTGSVDALIKQFARSPENQYQVELRAIAGDGTTISRNIVLSEKCATHGTPRIDGDLSDWKDAVPLHLDRAEQAVGIVPWMDWNLSAIYYLKWNEQNLYFAARVRDNVHNQPNPGENMWEGDSWQIALASEISTATRRGGRSDGSGVAAPSEPMAHCLGLCVDNRGVPHTWIWQGGGDPHKIEIAVRRPSKDELTYEVRIPRTLLDPLDLKPGEKFRFSVLLNDNDGGGRAGWMESTPGIGTGFNTNEFDEFELL